MSDSHQNGFHPFSPRDPIDDLELQAVDALLTAAGERWQRLPVSVDHANQHLDALVAQAHANAPPARRDTLPMRSPNPSMQGERVFMKPSWRTTLTGITLTLCLLAASIGVFVVFHQRQPSTPAANTPIASPTPRGPLTMPAAIIDLAMVSDHEGWALQNLADLTATPSTTPWSEQLWHLEDGIWSKVTPPGLAAPYSGNLTMVSAANGWLLTSNSTQNISQSVTQAIYHYDGATWKPSALPQLLGKGTPEFDTLQASANGDAWITGNYLDLSGKAQAQSAHVPLSTLSCLPNCGHALVLHWEQGKWTEVTVPANVTIFTDNGSLGWFPGTETDQMTLYHYQSGAWTRLRLGIAAVPAWVAMATPSDGWIGAYVPKNPGTNDGENNWVMYHFDGKTAQRIAAVTFQRCFGPNLAQSNAINPAEIWVPLISDQDCQSLPQLWHLHGSVAQTVALPTPYVALGVPVQSDASGNAWLLVAQQKAQSPGAVASFDDKHEAILRWNGAAWVVFAQTPA